MKRHFRQRLSKTKPSDELPVLKHTTNSRLLLKPQYLNISAVLFNSTFFINFNTSLSLAISPSKTRQHIKEICTSIIQTLSVHFRDDIKLKNSYDYKRTQNFCLLNVCILGLICIEDETLRMPLP